MEIISEKNGKQKMECMQNKTCEPWAIGNNK